LNPTNPYRAAGTFVGPSYVQRDADRELRLAIEKNQRYPYFLAPRQSGKSSLIRQTTQVLDQKVYKCIFIDLSTLPSPALKDSTLFWKEFIKRFIDHFTGFIIIRQCDVFKEVLSEVLRVYDKRVLVFLDEVDALSTADFKDEFFSIIRSIYNERAWAEEYKNIQFVLAGTVEPSKLISDPFRSPFNVGISIKISDLTSKQIDFMASHFNMAGIQLDSTVVDRIYQYTAGSVYLVQLIFENLWDQFILEPNHTISSNDVENTVNKIVKEAPDNSHFQTIHRSITEDAIMQSNFFKAISGQIDNKYIVDSLRLTGVIGENNYFRNKIYLRVFGKNGELDLTKKKEENRDLVGLQPPEFSRDIADWIEIHRLPITEPDVFGREHEIALLDNAWLDPSTNVVSIVAWGGVGKSALVNFWLQSLEAKDYGGAQRVYAWSFYKQGTTDRADAVSADLFIEAALDWFGDPEPTSGTPESKARRLASLIRKQRTLLLLDGLEPVQDPPGPNEGRLKDEGLRVLLRELAAFNPGLCVITSRLPLPDLASFERRTAPRIDLRHLSDEAGAALLRNGEVRGTQAELEEVAREFGGHALTLMLVASFLRTAYEGNVRGWRHIQLLDEDQRDRGHARRVLAAYEAWFEGKPEGQVLRAVGLFDRPAERSAIAALRADPPIDGLTEVVNRLPRTDWNRLVTGLRDLSLLAPPDPVMPETLDAHPLVREYFGSSLRTHHPEAWRAGHLRLYEYYKSSTKELPMSIDEMDPLYAAANHGCQAGEYNEVLHDVIVRRILRESEYFSTRKLGAFGSDLSAFSGFFTRPWVELVSQLSDEDRSFILECVGVRLRGLNRLREAIEPMEAAVRAQLEQGLDKLAARSYSRISNLFIFLGDFGSAEQAADRCRQIAEQCSDPLERMNGCHAKADALIQMGCLDEAESVLDQGDQIRQRRLPERQHLYYCRGIYRSELLMSQRQFDRAVEAALARIDWAEKEGYSGQGGILDLSLDYLALGAARVAQARSHGAPVPHLAEANLDKAVDGLRKAGQQQELPRGLLARALMYLEKGMLDRAKTDIDEAWTIAESGGMQLYLADAHLLYTRLHLGNQDQEAAKESFSAAKAMIDRMGYHRRDGDVQNLHGLLTSGDSRRPSLMSGM
jgi:tetratricopeptide (TPR) repeat protein